jgi:L-methionine (R)-S-oxide reductase
MNESELTHAVVKASSSGGSRAFRAAGVAAAIRTFGGYRWVGLYDVSLEQIALLGWDGPAPPAHPRFPRTDGLCGAAVATRRTVVVGEVAADARYLTTHATTRSEIVVPVFAAGVAVGVIDVESEQPDAFADADQRLLERCAALISPIWRGERDDTTRTPVLL